MWGVRIIVVPFLDVCVVTIIHYGSPVLCVPLFIEAIYELLSELLASPLINSIIVPYIIPYIPP